MIRTILVTTVVAVGMSAVVAQTDPIAVRKELMKKNNQHAKAVNAMVRGERPFDAAAVSEAFDQWTDTANRFGNLFPDDSKSGGNTRAKAAIWENRSGFDAKLAAFAKVVAAGKGKASTLEDVKASFPTVSKTCDDCHDLYRAPQQKK